MPVIPESADVVVIGGGMAGAAVAWELARRRAGSVLLLEREALPGMHATGRNAALFLQNVDDESNCRMGQQSRAFYAAPPPEVSERPLVNPVGSLLLYSAGDAIGRSRRAAERVRGWGLDVTGMTPAEARALVPILDERRFAAAVFCPTDGVLDIHGALFGLLAGARGAGAQIVTGVVVLGFRTDAAGRVTGVDTSRGAVRAGTVVVAAGPWAGELGASVGAPMPLRPTRRHLVVTTPWERADPAWPFVWDLDGPFYFRPESRGLLLSPCDIEDAPDLEERLRPDRVATAAAKASALIPDADGLGVAHAWAGLRTLTPDDRFLIGPDPRVAGLFWLAGLGGHGMTAGPAAGAVAADLLLDGRTERIDAAAVSPARFVGGPGSGASASAPPTAGSVPPR